MHASVLRKLLTIAFTLLLGTAFANADDWPGWRGPRGDNKVTGFTAPSSWPKDLTKKWQGKVGEGESSPIMAGDKIFAFGRTGSDETTVCLDVATGNVVWTYKGSAAAVTGPSAAKFSGTRSTPVVGEGKVCTLGVNGTVTCLNAAKGDLVWKKETTTPKFYTSTSPLISDGKCIVFGDGLTAYDLADGSVKWKWAGSAQAPYGSPVLMTVDGTKTVVTPSKGALAGVNLADGKELWKVSIGPTGGKGDYFHHYSTPLVDGNNVIYSVTGSQGADLNTICLKIEKKADSFKTSEVWNIKTSANKYHTPVLKDGLMYGVNASRFFYCLDAKTGKELWVDKNKRGDCGSILDAGSVLLALTSDQDLIAFKASDKQFEQIAKYRVGNGETWSVPIVDGNRIFVRDKKGLLTKYVLE